MVHRAQLSYGHDPSVKGEPRDDAIDESPARSTSGLSATTFIAKSETAAEHDHDVGLVGHVDERVRPEEADDRLAALHLRLGRAEARRGGHRRRPDG